MGDGRSRVVFAGFLLLIFHYFFGEVNDGFFDGDFSFGGEGGRFGGRTIGVKGGPGWELKKLDFVGDMARIIGGRFSGLAGLNAAINSPPNWLIRAKASRSKSRNWETLPSMAKRWTLIKNMT
jgi:hypothetical protein